MTADRIHDRLRAIADNRRARVSARYFRTAPGEYGAGDRFLGISVPVLRGLARELKDLPRAEVTRLLRAPWHEARLLALLILVRRHARGDNRERDAIHRLYLRNLRHVNNWDLVDTSAPQLVGAHLPRGRRALLRQLARSPRLWERRTAILATLPYIRAGRFADTLAIARLLRNDPHDLIHKAVGWMLREVGNRDRAVLERFLDVHAARMPRMMLRYAVERFPAAPRRRYLAR
jgi:3-methyladenine DNA glycosylase AlkD